MHLLNKNFIYFITTQTNCLNVRLFISLISNVLFEVALYVVLIILRFDIILSFFIEDK